MMNALLFPVEDPVDERLIVIYRELRDILAVTKESQYQRERSVIGAIDAIAPYVANVLTERPSG